MGCCKLGKRKDKIEMDGKHFDRNEKRFQISKLKEFLKSIDKELNTLKAVYYFDLERWFDRAKNEKSSLPFFNEDYSALGRENDRS
jgi:hypothetical protein